VEVGPADQVDLVAQEDQELLVEDQNKHKYHSNQYHLQAM
jgi:hypothetical protein